MGTDHSDTPVTLRGHPAPIMVRRGETILAAALRHGLAYPHGCQGGNCGACKSRLLAGAVTMGRYAAFALPEAERAAGLILACQAEPSGPCSVAWLDADDGHQHPYREVACRVAAVDRPARQVTRIWLAPEDGAFEFSAGQYAELTFAGHPPRDFSMASRPHDLPLAFHVRHRGAGVSRHIADAVAPGDPVDVRGPRGACFLRQLHSGPIYAVAGGTGFAPIWSIVCTALAKGMTQPIHVLFGVPDEADVYMADDLAALAHRHANFTFDIVLSDPASSTRRRTGWLHDAAGADIAGADLSRAKAYAAGPPPMVEAVAAVFHDAGLRPGDFHADAFTPAT